VGQKVAHFSTYHIFETTEDKMTPVSLQCSETSMMKSNYTFSRIYYTFFVKNATYYVISDVICVKMHPLTADDRALILALCVEKC